VKWKFNVRKMFNLHKKPKLNKKKATADEITPAENAPAENAPEGRFMPKVTLAEIKDMAKTVQGSIHHVYLHWSAGHYGQFFDDYHLNIDQDGSIYASTTDLSEHKDHTYMRNMGAVGVALACCFGATTEDFGEAPPTNLQIESMAQVTAVLCSELGLQVDTHHVLTHAEAANNLDGENPGYEPNGFPDGKYGPGYSCERWDLWFLHKGDPQWSGGDTLRGKAIWYLQNGV